MWAGWVDVVVNVTNNIEFDIQPSAVIVHKGVSNLKGNVLFYIASEVIDMQ